MITPDEEFRAGKTAPQNSMGFPAHIEQHEADDLFYDGVAAATAGKRATAERLLRASLALEPGRAKAWLWLAGVVGEPQQSVQYLEHVLELSPDEPHAREGLDWARQGMAAVGVPISVGAVTAAATNPHVSATAFQLPVAAGKSSRRAFAVVLAAAVGLIACISILYVLLGPTVDQARRFSGLKPPAISASPSYTPASDSTEQAVTGPAAIDLSLRSTVTPTPTVTPPPRPTASREPPTVAVVLVFSNPTTPAIINPTIPPTQAPTLAPPTAVPPTAVPPTAVPPTQVPPTAAPPTVLPPTAVPPTLVPPTAVPVMVVPPTALPQRVAMAILAPGTVASTTMTMTVTWNAASFRAPWYPQTNPLTVLIVPRWLQTPIHGAPVQQGKVIEVDLSEQFLRAFEDGILFMSVKVSTGLPGTPTVKGNYHIYNKYRSIGMSGPGYMLPNVPYTMFFYEGYSLHGTYWHSNFGRPMSHGCVNMKTDDAKRLFNWVDPQLPKGASSAKASKSRPGTLVVVHD